MALAGQRAIRRARRMRLTLIKKHLPALGLVTLIYSSLLLLIPFFPFFPRQFWYGAMAVGYLWLLEALQFHGEQAASISLGGLAEQWTSHELKKLRRAGWRLIDRVEFEDMDVDHVLVGPGGVLAIETKWSSSWKVEAGALETPFSDPVGQATFGARKIRLFLSSRGVDVEVLPPCVCGAPVSPPSEAMGN
jgi:hypothetical protein